MSLAKLLLLHLVTLGSYAQEMETITGTIYCDNDFSFYVNGELIVEDPIPIIRHNALNVSFSVLSGKDIVFAIEARDWANSTTGLEYDNRCVGDGGLRAMFSNGVVTNSSWVCYTHNYGPENWKECFGGQIVRNQSLQLLTACKADSTPQLVGCEAEIIPKPSGWTSLGFDDTHWEFAREFTDARVGWGLPPANCEIPGTTISSEVDPNGDPITCPQNLDWGESSFIWRPSLDLDNTILCRYTVRLEASGAGCLTASTFVNMAVVCLLSLILATVIR